MPFLLQQGFKQLLFGLFNPWAVGFNEVIDVFHNTENNNYIFLEQTRLMKLLQVLGQYGDTPIVKYIIQGQNALKMYNVLHGQ